MSDCCGFKVIENIYIINISREAYISVVMLRRSG